ncbi:MAG: cobalt-precorrin-6A reductase [Alphaproteobacteria bacterium]|nr:cobalt-precorrin-6A reductase [Alphaproteobacteria bacterium]
MAAPAPDTPPRLLILGGTAEGRALAEATQARFGPSLTVISALAGRTQNPLLPTGTVRVGGFGGTEGLASYLRNEGIGLLIDATHPFATQISAHACEAAARAGTERLALVRPPWCPASGDRWIEVATVEDAAAAIPAGARRVFLTVGVRSLAPFARHRDCWFLVRLVDAPAEPIPLARHGLICARGPFAEDDERALLTEHGIDCLVTRASGGEATAAKLAAARALALPVVMVRRPAPPPGDHAASLEDALAWIEQHLG